jgi:hypothetical protein
VPLRLKDVTRKPWQAHQRREPDIAAFFLDLCADWRSAQTTVVTGLSCPLLVRFSFAQDGQQSRRWPTYFVGHLQGIWPPSESRARPRAAKHSAHRPKPSVFCSCSWRPAGWNSAAPTAGTWNGALRGGMCATSLCSGAKRYPLCEDGQAARRWPTYFLGHLRRTARRADTRTRCPSPVFSHATWRPLTGIPGVAGGLSANHRT